jgi:hypothetical protein
MSDQTPRVFSNCSGVIMKKLLIGALAVGSTLTGSAAFAGQTEDILARLDALEKENAAIRRENVALSENKRLREQNLKLKSSSRDTQSRQLAPVSNVSAGKPEPLVATASATAEKPEGIPAAKSASISDRMADFFGAYAADLPVAYKAVPEAPGQFRIWAEGGAIWSGGDPVSRVFSLTDFTSSIGSLGGLGRAGNSIPGSFDLTPKLGWEAATGFDYRFANSPYHVSGQFRYGEGGKTSGTASSSGIIDPALLALLGGGGSLTGATIGGSETFAANYKESHWLADFAVGRDVFGTGASAMQVKGGIRIAEFVARTHTTDNTNSFFNLAAPIAFPGPGGILISSLSSSTVNLEDVRNSFLGAGPRIGIEGSVPFAGNWAFDYLGDAAVLFGTQKQLTTTSSVTTISPAILSILAGGNNSINSSTAQRFATVFNADIQVGVSYWFTRNVKLGVSYRLDALINVQNQDTTPVTNLTPDRYTHGPRVAVTGQF